MDTLTHALVGAAISDCGFRKRLGRIATPFALAAAALPDVDVATYFIAPEYAWAYHRGYTHSFFFQILAAPLIGYVGYRLSEKKGGYGRWVLLTILCLFSHTLIDLVTSWGTMPLLPFSNARISWDVAPILDLFVFSTTAASFVANRLLRWERVETFMNPVAYPVVYRHPRRQRAADWIGKIVVALVVCYLLVGWRQNRQTVEIARKELAEAGITAVEVRALPLMLTYVSWGIAARDAEGTIYNAVYSSYAPKPMRFDAFPTMSGTEVDKALASPDGRLFSWYAQGMYVADVLKVADGYQVTLRDRRFFTLAQSHLSRFSMNFDEDDEGQVTGVRSVQMGIDRFDLRDEFTRLWNLTRYGEAVIGSEVAPGDS